MSRRLAPIGVTVVVLGLLLLGVGWVVRVPMFAISPGVAVPAESRVTVEGHPADEVNGDLALTTVRLTQPNLLGALAAWVDDDVVLVDRSEVIPPSVDPERFAERQEELFVQSGRIAAAVGLRAAGFDVAVHGEGARVVSVVPGSPADGALREGDVITSLDGDPVQVASDLSGAVSARRPGETVHLQVRRERGETEVVVEVGSAATIEDVPGEGPLLGVALTTVDFRIEFPFEVTIEGGRIGGPSAGLMFALATYDLLDPVDLAAGRIVAGTGTIGLDGSVGPVGGVEQKVAAAAEAGAEVFLVPRPEASAARAEAGGAIEVVPVETFDDALAALRDAR